MKMMDEVLKWLKIPQLLNQWGFGEIEDPPLSN